MPNTNIAEFDGFGLGLGAREGLPRLLGQHTNLRRHLPVWICRKLSELLQKRAGELPSEIELSFASLDLHYRGLGMKLCFCGHWEEPAAGAVPVVCLERQSITVETVTFNLATGKLQAYLRVNYSMSNQTACNSCSKELERTHVRVADVTESPLFCYEIKLEDEDRARLTRVASSLCTWKADNDGYCPEGCDVSGWCQEKSAG